MRAEYPNQLDYSGCANATAGHRGKRILGQIWPDASAKALNACGQARRAVAPKTVWPSGLRRWLKAPVRKGVGSNPTAVRLFGSYEHPRNFVGQRCWLELTLGRRQRVVESQLRSGRARLAHATGRRALGLTAF